MAKPVTIMCSFGLYKVSVRWQSHSVEQAQDITLKTLVTMQQYHSWCSRLQRKRNLRLLQRRKKIRREQKNPGSARSRRKRIQQRQFPNRKSFPFKDLTWIRMGKCE